MVPLITDRGSEAVIREIQTANSQRYHQDRRRGPIARPPAAEIPLRHLSVRKASALECPIATNRTAPP